MGYFRLSREHGTRHIVAGRTSSLADQQVHVSHIAQGLARLECIAVTYLPKGGIVDGTQFANENQRSFLGIIQLLVSEFLQPFQILFSQEMVKQQTDGKLILFSAGLKGRLRQMCLAHQFAHTFDSGSFGLRKIEIMKDRGQNLVADFAAWCPKLIHLLQ